jgi:ABC-type Na+ efflux pump permease subunit
MWAIAHGVIEHNLKRGMILGLIIGAAIFIWLNVDPYYSKYDFEIGELSPTKYAMFCSVIITLVVLINELPKEMSVKFHLLILSKPISRLDYLLGKIIGLYVVSVVTICILTTVAFTAMMFQCEEAVSLNPNFLLPLMHYVLYLWIFCVTAGVAGAFLSEAFCLIIIGMALTASYIVGLIPSIREAGVGAGAGLFLKLCYYMVPNYQYFGSSNFHDYSPLTLLYLAFYVMGYTGIILPTAISNFEKRSFT